MLAILLESGNIEILRSFDEKCQQLMNAIGVENYIAPHSHLLDPKSECLIAVRALFTAVIFSDKGNVEQIEVFGTEKFKNLSVGLELPLFQARKCLVKSGKPSSSTQDADSQTRTTAADDTKRHTMNRRHTYSSATTVTESTRHQR